jgi:predicted kinase
MGFTVMIRGPLGVGKTTIARRLARELGASYISIDRILDERGLWEHGRLSEFLKANQVAASIAQRSLGRGEAVVIDGNFYWKGQIEDLLARLAGPHFEFTLTAPMAVCAERDARRTPSHGREAVRAVYAKTGRVTWGVHIDAARPPNQVVGEILGYLPAHPRDLRGGVGDRAGPALPAPKVRRGKRPRVRRRGSP